VPPPPSSTHSTSPSPLRRPQHRLKVALPPRPRLRCTRCTNRLRYSCWPERRVAHELRALLGRPIGVALSITMPCVSPCALRPVQHHQHTLRRSQLISPLDGCATVHKRPSAFIPSSTSRTEALTTWNGGAFCPRRCRCRRGGRGPCRRRGGGGGGSARSTAAARACASVRPGGGAATVWRQRSSR
jgi:hypothetical protein